MRRRSIDIFPTRGFGSAASWKKEQLPPEAGSFIGDRSKLPSWDFYLIDMTQNTGESVTPVGKLKKNNLLRFENGDFAPTVGITEEMRAECDVELYLDGGVKYCDEGTFDPVAFYEQYGVGTKLYNASGTEVRVLRPWETTSKDYSIFAGFNKGVYVVDKVEGKSGKIWSGIYTEDAVPILDGIDLRETCPLLPPTGLSPCPVCTIGDKARAFFYLYEGEKNCKSGAGISDVCTMFLNGRTYPRGYDVNQIRLARFSRANNVDPEASYPFAEGGFLTLNAYILYLEILYGTKYLHSTSMFGNGISSTNPIRNESDLRSYGGVKYRKKNNTTWLYETWSSTPSIMHYVATKTTVLSNWVNNGYPKEQCMESQMAASYANEIGVQEGEEFDFYGSKYWYKNVPGAKENDMNVIVYKEMTGTISALDENDNPAEFDIEVVLRMSLFGGMNLSGDVHRYCGGGYEQVSTHVYGSIYGNPVDLYVEFDQKKWANEKSNTINEGQKFGFESLYKHIATNNILGDSFTLSRIPYTAWKEKKGGGLGTGECEYNYDNAYWVEHVNVNTRVRIGARFGGPAGYSGISPRSLIAYYMVSGETMSYCGLTQVLLNLNNINYLNQ